MNLREDRWEKPSYYGGVEARKKIRMRATKYPLWFQTQAQSSKLGVSVSLQNIRTIFFYKNKDIKLIETVRKAAWDFKSHVFENMTFSIDTDIDHRYLNCQRYTTDFIRIIKIKISF